jgi:tetratricopeptide (TPR) repeat protein
VELIRQGNVAFAHADYEGALHFYELAGQRTGDPGLVAFNRAAAYYRLGRYREAELDYRRCLEDDAAEPSRRARALYDLGNCLMQQAQGRDAALLEQAVQAYEGCLGFPPDDGNLRADAQHNLELAKLLWLKAKASNPPNSNEPSGSTDPKHKDPGSKKNVDPKTAMGDPSQAGKDKGKLVSDKAPNGQKAIETKETVPGRGNLPPIPDADALQPLSPEDTAVHLDRIAERILRERREFRRGSGIVAPHVKDW